jgi:DNA-binding response OmpR family regulator
LIDSRHVSQPTVLVVDDDLPILMLMKNLLKEFGFNAVTAASGEEALEAARKETPSIVLLDKHMPGMHGFDVIRALRADYATLPILLLTGDPVSKEELATFGADGAVQKPFDLTVLIAQIREKLGR